MFSKFFEALSEVTTPAAQLREEFFAKFQADYVNGRLLNDLPKSVKYECLLLANNNSKSSSAEKAFFVFTSIRLSHIALILADNNYLEPLTRKCRQLIYVDEYGDSNGDDWVKELKRFVASRIHKFDIEYGIDDFYIDAAKNKRLWGQAYTGALLYSSGDHEFYNLNEQVEEDIFTLVASYTNELLDSHPSTQGHDLDSVTDPYEYERQVAESMNALGWSARATSGSGDQGVDVIAQYNDIKLVIQCKLYSQPVGNKAVQEIHAGMGYENAIHAAVITNTSYTKSAKQLARSLGVLLCHHDQLGELTQQLLGKTPHSDESEEIDFQDNQSFITKRVSLLLESQEWLTSFDEDEAAVEDNIVFAEAGDNRFYLYCTDFVKPVSLIEMRFIVESFSKVSDDFAFLIITATNGLSEQAEAYLDKFEGCHHLNNDSVENLDNILFGESID
tara:strand:- start:120846 stop:122183 length:1338 start_codon:yes stop_codon:yes gene_type:complete